MSGSLECEPRACDAMVLHSKTQKAAASVAEIRALFEDDHVHMALIVGEKSQLITTIERSDIDVEESDCASAAGFGTLEGRTVGAAASLDDVTHELLLHGRRRVAVVDQSGRLLGLLCLKRDGTGYCTDAGIRQRTVGSKG